VGFFVAIAAPTTRVFCDDLNERQLRICRHSFRKPRLFLHNLRFG